MKRRGSLKAQKGQELVEFALVAPVLILLIVAIVEFMLVVLSYNTIANAAREGARYGSIHPSDVAGIEAAARDMAPSLDHDRLIIVISFPSGAVRVEATYALDMFTTAIVEALGGNPTMQIRAVATMQLEG
ncbi:MAG: pilus assembly protein [Anaerolineae bacterium]|nr:pilus assembly protein [Anaerolineae bacterium]